MSSDPERSVLSTTWSVCPECLQRIPATCERQGDCVYLVKSCPTHGRFTTKIWKGDIDFTTWSRPKRPAPQAHPHTAPEKGCPFDCGLCSNHKQHTCTALIEITNRCNLSCPICFAAAGEEDRGNEPSLKQIGEMYDQILTASGTCNIQISGGEPTVRDDLTDIIALGQAKGFSFIQLNTNGLRLADSPHYAAGLKQAGLASVFLQFDGVSARAHTSLRGRDLRKIKEQAIRNCEKARLGVVLVPTLIPGCNTREIGDIIAYGVRFAPTVRGVHFQPVSYFGRYPGSPRDCDRLTLPELMNSIKQQTGGTITPPMFAPPGCEHERCSFSGNFLILEKDNTLMPLRRGGSSCCCSATEQPLQDIPSASHGREKSISFTARQWAFPQIKEKQTKQETPPQDDLDRFLARARTHTFSISAMAFQDAWSLDLERLQGCCIHVAHPDGRMVPFCAYNLTSSTGEPLHR